MKIAYFLLFTALSGSALGGNGKEKPTKKKHADPPTIAEFWRQSGMSLATAQKLISNPFCYDGYTRHYLACVLAVKEAVKIASEGEYELTTVFHLNSHPDEYSDPVAKLGDMRIAASKFKPSGNVVQVFEASRKKFTRDITLDQSVKSADSLVYDFNKLLDWLERNYISAENEAIVSGKAVTKLLNVLYDPHTYIMPGAFYEFVSKNDSRSFAGVGIAYTFLQGFMVVEKVIKNGPAESAGLKVKDVITHIDGLPLKGKKASAVSDMVGGEDGSQVTFSVQRGDQTSDVIVRRGLVKIDNVEHQTLHGATKDIGYVKLRSFMPQNSCSDVKDYVTKASSEDIAGIVLDLRGNGGGRLDQAVCIVNIFLGRGKTVVTARNPDNNEILETLMTSKSAVTDLPVAVLIDAGSASASEIVAGALKDHERGLIVGEKSFGKGTIQSLGKWGLNEKVTLAKTTARFHLASGWSNQMTGVTSDIEVYRKPEPSEIDKFAIREKDEFLPLDAGPDDFAASAAHLKYIAEIKDCLAKSENAEREFQREMTDFFDPDFQLLEAKDTITCMSEI